MYCISFALDDSYKVLHDIGMMKGTRCTRQLVFPAKKHPENK